jgi:OOP family OmpA-OmpF porin
MKIQIALGLMSASLFISQTVSAEEIGKGWYAEGNLGYSVMRDSETADRDPDSDGMGTPSLTTGLATLEDDVQLGLALGYYTDYGRVEFEILNLRNDFESGAHLGAERLEALAGLVNVWFGFGGQDSRFRPYVGGGIGVADMSADPLGDTVAIAQLGAGFDYRYQPRWVLDTQIRYISAGELEETHTDAHTYTYSYEGFLLTTGFRRHSFDPTPYRDGDGDGVPDKVDDCRRSKSGSIVDTKGCAGDSDNDGINDGEDKCPSTPSGEEVNSRGCSIDPDKDGVVAGIDECPDTPAGELVNSRGCSDDDDRDGVINSADACPNTDEGLTVLSNGCGSEQEWVLRGVYFEFDRSRLTKNAKQILDGLGQIVKSSPGAKIELQGHTDDKGGQKYNEDLSQARADQVKDYLVGLGIRADRISTVGYGESKPTVANTSDDSREVNRRVVVKVLSN